VLNAVASGTAVAAVAAAAAAAGRVYGAIQGSLRVAVCGAVVCGAAGRSVRKSGVGVGGWSGGVLNAEGLG
jgi:hypothetical protein